MKELIKISVLILCAITLSGCFSAMAYQSTKREMLGKRVVEYGDASAIRAFAAGNTVGIGVNVLAYEVVAENPIKQLGAALLDAAMIWGAIEGYEELSNSKNDTVSIEVTGDGNYILINYDTDGNPVIELKEDTAQTTVNN